MDNIVMLGEKVALRLKSLLSLAAVVAVAVTAHADMLPFNKKVNDTIELIAIVIVSLNNPVVSLIQERK